MMLNFAERILTARNGATHIFSVGQAGYIIKSASGKMLAIDLYLSDCVERAEGNIGFKRGLCWTCGTTWIGVLQFTNSVC